LALLRIRNHRNGGKGESGEGSLPMKRYVTACDEMLCRRLDFLHIHHFLSFSKALHALQSALASFSLHSGYQ
jgi:hypothetical protein